MTIVAERASQYATQPLAAPPAVAAPQRNVVVVVDACCELDPAVAARLGIMVLPRPARVDGKPHTLNAEQTLHASCWPRLPRRIVAEPYSLGTLAQIYQHVLDNDLSVLALCVPGSVDGTASVALAARSILLSGQHKPTTMAQRVAVAQVPAVGHNFAFLVQAAARGAADGMSLHQIITLLERLQTALRSFYVTGLGGPPAHTRLPGRQKGVGLFGNEQLWTIDHERGLFVRTRRGWNVSRTLFEPNGPLVGQEITAIGNWRAEGLLRNINTSRAAATLPPLAAQPGGLSLANVFPGGCVELSAPPDENDIIRICDVIRRIDRRTAQPVRNVRQRGGI